MIEVLLFLAGLSIGWLLLPRPFEMERKLGFMDGVEAALNAEKQTMKDGRNVLIIKGLFDE